MLIRAASLSVVMLASCRTKTEPVIRVAAASDLTAAFDEAAQGFEKKTGKKVNVTYGSSGLLARQLEDGAPFDLFASAKPSYVDEVNAKGACDATTKAIYGRGRIIVMGKLVPAALGDLRDAKYTKIAIANPDHAPYGKAAKEALIKQGIWDAVASRIVMAENVRQAMQFAETGNVEAAIVALSLAGVLDGSGYLLVDASLHAPIEQSLVVCKNGSSMAGAKDFAAYLSSPDGNAILARYGLGHSD